VEEEEADGGRGRGGQERASKEGEALMVLARRIPPIFVWDGARDAEANFAGLDGVTMMHRI